MIPAGFFAPYLAANVIALAILIAAVHRPSVARWAAVAVFVSASVTNATTAWKTPQVYLEYAALTPVPVYEAFIDGWFSTHIQPMVLSIAAGQLVLAILLALGRPWRLGGVAGSLVFLAAIAPLGIGSGFPFSLTFGAAVVVADRRLAAAAVQRRLMNLRQQGTLADRFIAAPDAFECHEIVVRAPADLVYDTACRFDLMAVPLIRAIFHWRARLLGAATPVGTWPRGLLAETQALGWRPLAERPHREIVMGAVTQPWMPDVTFRGLGPEAFVTFSEPDMVRILWTLEVRPDVGGTRLRTQSRVAGTDTAATRRFRRYWRLFGAGIVLIRLLVLPAIRREAEARHGT